MRVKAILGKQKKKMIESIRIIDVLILVAFVFTTKCQSQNDEDSMRGVFIDERDGKEYSWVKMNNDKIWMATNLGYDDESSVCYDGEDENCRKFGRLYSWSSINSICPNGWRVPTDKEWWNMVTPKVYPYKGYDMYPMGRETSGSRLKELTNDSIGLQLQFGGTKEPDYGFLNIDGIGYYWTSSEHKEESKFAWYYGVDGKNRTDLKQENKIVRVATAKEMMFSCRCIKIEE